MARRQSLMWVTIIALSACALVSLWRLAGVNDTVGISLRSAGATPPEPEFVCPRCEGLFTKLEKRSIEHKGRQEIGIQLRGEPKVKRKEIGNLLVSTLRCWVNHYSFSVVCVCFFALPLSTCSSVARGVRGGMCWLVEEFLLRCVPFYQPCCLCCRWAFLSVWS